MLYVGDKPNKTNCSVFQVLGLGLKWPNDIYAGSLKVGGLLVTSVISEGSAVCNVG